MMDYTEYEYKCFCKDVINIPVDIYESEILAAFENYHGDYDEFVRSLVALLRVDDKFECCDYTCLDNFIGLLMPEKHVYEISLRQYIFHHWFTCKLELTFKTWLGAYTFVNRLLDGKTDYEMEINKVI